jgi:undecaprenyl diphosphate synthase
MELMMNGIPKELPLLQENNIKLLIIGDIAKLPEYCRNSVNEVVRKTSNNSGLILCIALSYSGKWDIMQASTKMAKQFKDGVINESDLNEKYFSSLLSTNQFPDPELIIRTSGEKRISNFFLWQAAYAELYFTDKLWPEFDENDFFDALNYFQNIERRFGKTSEQL